MNKRRDKTTALPKTKRQKQVDKWNWEISNPFLVQERNRQINYKGKWPLYTQINKSK